MPLFPPLNPQPSTVQKLNWTFNPLGYIDKNTRRYGELFGGKISGALDQPIYLLGNPDALQYMLTHDAREFSAPGAANALLKPILGENSILLIDGERHRKRRQIVMPPFHGERLKAYGNLICQLTHNVIDQWPLQTPFRARDEMQKISMRVILQAVFGVYSGDRYEAMEERFRDRLESTSSPLAALLIFFPTLLKDFGALSPGRQIKRMDDAINELIYDEIGKRRAENDEQSGHPLPGEDNLPARENRTDILSLLMSAKDETGTGMSYQELRDELVTLLFAGHETTATALAWALYWIYSLPAVREKLRQELAELGPSPDPLSVAKLPYLNAFCNETLRIYPVGFLTFPRRVEAPIEMLGYQLKPGMLLMGCLYMLHRQPKLYPEPDQFRPERFLERQFSPYEFMPFGGGARRCVGSALAQFEMKLVISTILSRCSMSLADSQPVIAQRRGVTLGPKGGVKIQLVARKAQT